MNGVVCLVACCLLGLAVATTPSAPQIPDVFYSKVSVSVKEGNDYWRGGGLYAFDTPAGRARTDVRLDGNAGYRSIHILDRYDLNATYIILDDRCEKKATSGTLEDPWAWVAKASFAGNSTYGGNTLNEWTFALNSVTTLKVSVLASDPTKPVFFSSRTTNGSFISEWDMIFLEFDPTTPENWVWYVPEMCENNSTGLMNLKGSASATVYFANSQWDCTDPSCSSRVPVGSGQPGYECAEFVARSLAYGGYLPGLAWNAAQGTYGSWRGYNLLLTTGLAGYLGAIGFQKLPNSGGSVNAAVAIFGDAGDGYFSHTCIGIASDTVDCHNNARQGYVATGIMYQGIDAVYGP